MSITQIQVTKETRAKLKNIKITNRESYEEIITRLLNQGSNTIKDKINVDSE